MRKKYVNLAATEAMASYLSLSSEAIEYNAKGLHIYRGNILLREWRVVHQENGQAARLQQPVQNGQTWQRHVYF